MMGINEKVLVFLLALIIDLFFGEFPSVIHPVVYMGCVGKFFDNIYKSRSSKAVSFVLGMISLIVELIIWGGLGYFLQSFSKRFTIAMIFEVYILKSTFSIRSLYEHVKRCYTNDVELLRKNVSMIVSRDTSKLDKSHLYSAAVESLAENISDSITGPLFYYVLFGLPGAVVYRVVNTYDALFGYRNARYEWFGKFPARFDDLLNLVPSRLTALFISFFNFKRSWEYIKKYGGIKINATYPMSAFAGVLGLGFEKIGYYKFDGKLPDMEDLGKALRLYKKVVFLIILVVVFSCMVV